MDATRNRSQGQGRGNSSDLDSPDRPNLTRRGLERFLNVGQRWVERNTAARRIPGQHRCGREWRYKRADIEKAQLSGQVLLPKAKVVSLGLKRRRR